MYKTRKEEQLQYIKHTNFNSALENQQTSQKLDKCEIENIWIFQ